MGGKTIEAKFDADAGRVFDAAKLTAASLGYTIFNSDKQSGTLTFNTGRSMKSWAGQDLTATLMQVGGYTRVIVGGSIAEGGNPFGGGQLVSWGEKDALSRKFLEALEANLPKVAISSAAPDSKVCPDCAEEVKAAAKKCRFCDYIFE
jgi:hypothetical protein